MSNLKNQSDTALENPACFLLIYYLSSTTGYKLPIRIQFITHTITKIQKPVTVVTAIVIVM